MVLKVSNLHAYYGKSHVLHGVDMHVKPGEIVALLGRNGSGRSTTAKAIMGLVDCQGSSLWKGKETLGLNVHQNLLLGQKRGQRTHGGRLTICTGCFPVSRSVNTRKLGYCLVANSKC